MIRLFDKCCPKLGDNPLRCKFVRINAVGDSTSLRTTRNGTGVPGFAQTVLTGGEARVRVGSVPAGGRGAAPHAVLVGRKVAHVAQVAVAVSAHGRVRQLGDTCRSHVVGGRGHGAVVAHVVLLHGRLRDLRLPVGGERCPQVVVLHT